MMKTLRAVTATVVVAGGLIAGAAPAQALQNCFAWINGTKNAHATCNSGGGALHELEALAYCRNTNGSTFTVTGNTVTGVSSVSTASCPGSSVVYDKSYLLG
ncbi:hypothetical protein [Actinokineospora globicatena]|uniref:Alpha amylase inhibitor n=1 Tax=Actinokineospora globicatena TaxID=103729 RepID=A0A9W6V8M3_9PSEU|nr:hypothetical protein [Actinokineospora globicatena]GLW91114.1 hypothetical protein Aglo03_19300 [Actinokineospora globicatena]